MLVSEKWQIITKKDDKPKISTTIDGTDIEQGTNFPYLGQIITEDGRCEEEIKRRINIAKTTFSKMSKVLKSKKIALNTRKRILQCYIWSTLQYGVETWTITESMAKRLSAFEMWCYRKMLGISWMEKVLNEEVLERAKIKKRLYNFIQTKKLQYFGHIICQNRDTLHRIVLDGKVNSSRGRRRPSTKWTTNITKWTELEYH